MREGIGLYRGKREDNGEWVASDCILQFEEYPIKKCRSVQLWVDKEGWVFVIPESVGEYIGNTDKNSIKIFEGDIGRYKQTDGAKWEGKPIICTGKVVYNAKTASFAIDSIDEIGAKNYDYFPIKDFEIIGNVLDNPELLEQNR